MVPHQVVSPSDGKTKVQRGQWVLVSHSRTGPLSSLWGRTPPTSPPLNVLSQSVPSPGSWVWGPAFFVVMFQALSLSHQQLTVGDGPTPAPELRPNQQSPPFSFLPAGGGGLAQGHMASPNVVWGAPAQLTLPPAALLQDLG